MRDTRRQTLLALLLRLAAAQSSFSNSTSTTSAEDAKCSCGYMPLQFEWTWPQVNLTEVLVAKVIVKINRETDETSTITSYIPGATGVSNLEELWNSALNTTGVTISDGSPVITIDRPIKTGLGEDDFIATSQRIVHPSNVMDLGYIVSTEDKARFSTISNPLSTVTECAETATHGTIALTPADGSYSINVKPTDWQSMLPEDIKTRCDSSMRAPVGAIGVQTALTETTTEYDDYQQSQVPTTTKKSDSTTPPSVSATPTKEPERQTTTKEPEKQTTKESSASTQPPATNTPAQDEPSQNQPSQNQPSQSQPPQSQDAGNQQQDQAQGSQAPAGSSWTSTQTTTHTPVILEGSTLTAGGSAATISGTTYSLGSSSELVVNGNTMSLTASAVSTDSGGIGTLIWEGLGGTVVTASHTGAVTAVATFTGAAPKAVSWSSGWILQIAALLAAAVYHGV